MLPVSVCAEEKIDRTPDPYGINEFNTWQKDLRRFEIISFGALPFVSLLSFWAYDMIRYATHNRDPAYKPWPVKNPAIAQPLTETEQLGVFFTSVGISIGVALIDFSYRAIKRSIQKKKIDSLNLNAEDAIQIIPVDENGKQVEKDNNDKATKAENKETKDSKIETSKPPKVTN